MKSVGGIELVLIKTECLGGLSCSVWNLDYVILLLRTLVVFGSKRGLLLQCDAVCFVEMFFEISHSLNVLKSKLLYILKSKLKQLKIIFKNTFSQLGNAFFWVKNMH